AMRWIWGSRKFRCRLRLQRAFRKTRVVRFEGGNFEVPIIKRSIDLNGRKTSVTLEDEFWEALRTIAHGKKTTLVAIVDQINQTRNKINLSSAIRVFVLKQYLPTQAWSEPVSIVTSRWS